MLNIEETSNVLNTPVVSNSEDTPENEGKLHLRITFPGPGIASSRHWRDFAQTRIRSHSDLSP